jgi:TPR repeat protein
MTEVEGKDPLAPLWVKAREAAERGDIAGTLYVWQALADRGAWQVCAKIGWLYERGADGVEKNMEKALFWYRKAVFEGDDSLAHVGLGRAYLTGEGAEKRFDTARSHFEKAESKGEPEGALYLGMIYYQGLGVCKNIERAKPYLEKAANARYCYAFIPLALIALGKGRLIQATRLFLKARRCTNLIAKEDPSDDRLIGFGRSRAQR